MSHKNPKNGYLIQQIENAITLEAGMLAFSISLFLSLSALSFFLFIFVLYFKTPRYCTGQYPPAEPIQALLRKKQDFKQLEDFNKGEKDLGI